MRQKIRKIILDVSSLLSSEIGTTEKIEIKENLKEVDEEVKVKKPISGTLILSHLDDNSLSGLFNLKTEVELSCIRCLKKFNLPLILNYEQAFSLQKQDDVFPIFSNRTIDLYPSIRQEILLSIPIMPICNKRCKGVGRGRS